MPKLKPLEEFVCDYCGEVIENVEEGKMYLLWQESKDQISSFNVVHTYKMIDGIRENTCQFDRFPGSRLAFSSICLKNIEEFNNLFHKINIFCNLGKSNFINVHEKQKFFELHRRLTIPYYEEARQYFADDILREFLCDIGYGMEESEFLTRLNHYEMLWSFFEMYSLNKDSLKSFLEWVEEKKYDKVFA